MMTQKLATDETLRSRLAYGTAGFPFSCYLDVFTHTDCLDVAWHWHNELEFSYVETGCVVCRVGADHLTLQPGDTVFINSQAIHRFEGSDGARLVNLIFQPAFIAEQTSIIYAKYVQPFLAADLAYKILAPDGAVRLLREVYSLTRADRFGRELEIRNRITALWVRFAESAHDSLCTRTGSRRQTEQARLHLMITYFHDNYHRHLSLAEIAASASISKSEALRCFHSGLETTPVQYLNAYRLSRAAELLRTSAATIGSVADACGFESAAYFCRMFRAAYGAAPSAFRDGAV